MTEKKREFISEETIYFLDDDNFDVDMTSEEIEDLKKTMDMIPEVEISEGMLEKEMDEENIDALIGDIMNKEGVNMEEVFEEVEEKHKGIEFLSEDELLNFDGDTVQGKIKFKDIQDKRLKELTHDEKKVAFGRLIIITIFILLNFFVITQFINIDTDDTVVDSSDLKEVTEVQTDGEYTRYITEENYEKMDKDSKWKNNKELSKTLEEVFENQENIDNIEGYELDTEIHIEEEEE